MPIAAIAGWQALRKSREAVLTDKSGVQCRWIYEAILVRAHQSPLFPSPDAFPQNSPAWSRALLESRQIDASWLTSPLCRDRPVAVSYYYFRPTLAHDSADELLILENPQLHDSRRAWGAFSKRGLVMLEGDDLWNAVDGRIASDGTVFKRPVK
ncbi:MAG: hypothetical protein JSS51_11700 [Planctomycetes bacterium]|nr:hypothetical protein [Planctomycetota bacterium]